MGRRDKRAQRREPERFIGVVIGMPRRTDRFFELPADLTAWTAYTKVPLCGIRLISVGLELSSSAGGSSDPAFLISRCDLLSAVRSAGTPSLRASPSVERGAC